MGYVALFFAFVLSFVALRQDKQQTAGTSSALWLSTIWMMRVGSRAFGYWLPGGLDPWGDPVILSVLTVAGLVVIARRTQKVGTLLRENQAFLLFFVYMSVSVLWTADPFDSFKRWFRIVGDITMVLIVLTEAQPFTATLSVIRRAVLVLIPLSLVISLYFPALGIGEAGSWTGVTVDKNWLGLVCALATALLLFNWAMRKRKPELSVDIRLAGVPFEVPYLLLSVYMLFGGGGGQTSKSSTAIVLLALAIGLFRFIEYVKRKQI